MKSIVPCPVAVASLTALLAACSSGLPATQGGRDATPITDAPVVIDTAVDSATDTTIDGQQCVSTVEQHPDEGATHVPCTQTVTYQTNPPSSGNHYSCWAAYQTYTSPVPWGNLVHSLEHGAMIVVYNCPQGCAAEVAAIQSFIDALPLDPNCGASLHKNRIILMPDPNLNTRFAATAWRWTLKSNCFDAAAFQQFFDAHYDHGNEVICSDGWMGDGLCVSCG
ncbi:MAG TPA: DUF3105 domain-containing protein [Polyangia bacterium]|nr:DUF3105 domain-containing protein [Polyangia bacterium]